MSVNSNISPKLIKLPSINLKRFDGETEKILNAPYITTVTSLISKNGISRGASVQYYSSKFKTFTQKLCISLYLLKEPCNDN